MHSISRCFGDQCRPPLGSTRNNFVCFTQRLCSIAGWR